MEIKLVQFDTSFLSSSWIWLNDPEIKVLTNTSVFSKEEQANWFMSLKNKSDYLIWGVEIDHIPIGACGLKNIDKNKAEYWGYIGVKEYWGLGLGTQMMNKLHSIASNLGLNNLFLNVISTNKRAINLYEKMGYFVVDKSQEILTMRKIINH